VSATAVNNEGNVLVMSIPLSELMFPRG
jgi:hypothetical protein